MKVLLEAGDLIEGLRYVDDLELVNDDIVGCSANATDVATDCSPDADASRPRRFIIMYEPG